MRKQSTPAKVLCYVFLILVILFVLAPIFATVLFSFDEGRFSTLPLRGFTTKWYVEAFSSSVVVDALKNSVIVAFLAAATATILGFLASYGMRHWESRLKNVFTVFTLSAMVIPWTILGLAMLIYFQAIGIKLSLFAVYLSHVVFLSPLALSNIDSKMRTIPFSYEDAARDLGAGGITTIVHVILPQLFPALLASMLLCFTLSFDEFIIAWFVCGFDITLPIYLYNIIRGGTKPTISAIGAVVFCVSITMSAISQTISHKE